MVALFEIGSVICGAAPNSIAFIIGRAIAGLGGAGIFSGVTIIMITMVPLRKRPMFQGLFGMVFGLASVLGPLVGGALTDAVSWRWAAVSSSSRDQSANGSTQGGASILTSLSELSRSYVSSSFCNPRHSPTHQPLCGSKSDASTL